MYYKLIFLSLSLMAIGATLLVWRSQRIELKREAAQLKLETKAVQESIWKKDLELSRELDPDQLREALKDIEMDLRATHYAQAPKHELESHLDVLETDADDGVHRTSYRP